jgi:hypothetical protein
VQGIIIMMPSIHPSIQQLENINKDIIIIASFSFGSAKKKKKLEISFKRIEARV